MLIPLLDHHERVHVTRPTNIFCPKVSVIGLAQEPYVTVVGLMEPCVLVEGIAVPMVAGIDAISVPTVSVNRC